MALSQPQRDLWLSDLHESDPDTAAQISDLLALRAREDFEDFLAGPPPMPPRPVGAVSMLGRQIGPYLIDAEIGRGPTASVWRAYRNDGHHSGTVAIKFVQAAWIGRDSEKRFRVEARSLGLLDHPNIARLLDAGVLEQAQPYLVLEYVDGEPIDTYCNRLGLHVRERVKLFMRVLAALAHAHSHLIAHRGIKTENVLVTRDGTVKLLDLGVAALLDRETPSGRLTKGHARATAPRFATPEQLVGLPVTTATDEYAAALVLYLMLTGEHPFGAAAATTGEFIGAVILETPPPASTQIGERSVPRRFLRGDLDQILQKALMKETASRYVSISSFADDLDRFLRHQPLRAGGASTGYRTGKFIRRHRTAAGIVLLAALLAAAGTFGAVKRAQQACKIPAIDIRSSFNRAHG